MAATSHSGSQPFTGTTSMEGPYWALATCRTRRRPRGTLGTKPSANHSDNYRWVSASASYLLTNEVIAKIDLQAGRYAPGPSKEFDIEWTTKASDA